MFVQCISPFGEHAVGDVIEIPDGSEVADRWFTPVAAPEGPGGSGDPITPPVS